MAIFHSHVQVITRGKGKSAVAAAAYRAGDMIVSERDGIVHDYTHKGGVVYTEIILPSHAPVEYKKRATLWNAVEKIEKSRNSQLARELDIALPAELTRGQYITLAREYVRHAFVNAGMCADLCIHDKGDGNPHFHVMLTMRPIDDDGSWGAKSRKVYLLDNDGNKIYDPKKRQYKCRSVPTTDWNDRENADKWRALWETMANAYLEHLGFDSRIDRRSYAERGIEKIPSVHMGAAASQMERKGIRTERGDRNREIEFSNKQIRQLNARMSKLEKWLAEENANGETPPFADIISDMLGQPGYAKITQIKNAAETLLFLKQNNIADVAGLERKVGEMKGNLGLLRDELRKLDRRIKTLNEHIAQSENYRNYRRYKRHYDRLKSVYKEAMKATGIGAKRRAEKALEATNRYRETHRSELALFSESDKYLRGVLQKRFDPSKLPPITKWRDELEAKTARRNALYRDYHALKGETQKVEQIKRCIDSLLDSSADESAAETTANRQGYNTQNSEKGIIEQLRDYQQKQAEARGHAQERKPTKPHDMGL